jgi:hypothetical protein
MVMQPAEFRELDYPAPVRRMHGPRTRSIHPQRKMSPPPIKYYEISGWTTSTCAATRRKAPTTPFDMAVRNDIDRFHLVADVIDRVPGLAACAAYAKQAIRDKLIEHREYVVEHGEDLPEIRNWKWSVKPAAERNDVPAGAC